MPGMRLNYQLWTSNTGTNSEKAYCSAIYSFILQIITNAFLFLFGCDNLWSLIYFQNIWLAWIQSNAC